MKNATISVKTEYRAFGKKPDGTWKMVTHINSSNEEGALELLEDYLSNVKAFPDLYYSYEEYEIRKRQVITVVEDWDACE